MYVFDLPVDTAVKQFKDMNEAFWSKKKFAKIIYTSLPWFLHILWKYIEKKSLRGGIKIDYINSIYAFPYPATAAQISPYYRGWVFILPKYILSTYKTIWKLTLNLKSRENQLLEELMLWHEIKWASKNLDSFLLYGNISSYNNPIYQKKLFMWYFFDQTTINYFTNLLFSLLLPTFYWYYIICGPHIKS